MKDATEPIRKAAGKMKDVVIGTSCTQTSFKIGGKTAFLYIGEQGGRHKAMFKLDESKIEAEELAKKHPADFQVGTTAWVTVRFSDSKALPKTLWRKWLNESYALGQSNNNEKASAKQKLKSILNKKKPISKKLPRKKK